MTDVKRLLDEATPLPWGDPFDIHYGDYGWYVPGSPLGETDDSERGRADATLAVYAVNRLPDYEAAVLILAAFMELPGYHGEDCYIHTPDLTTCDCGVQQARIAAKAALARLRERVPT